jgi:nucleotide-binding universal stress UspA family protein
LLATDGSIPALVATGKAVDMARDQKARLIVLSVTEQGPVTGIEKMAGDKALLRIPGVDGVDYARQMAAGSKVDTKFITREGAVVREIIDTAVGQNARMIIVGTSEPRGFDGFMFGNVAEALVRQAPCSVLVVRPTEAEIKAAIESIKAPAAPVTKIDISDITGSAKFKLGLGLFAVYLACYALFTLAGSFYKAAFGIRIFDLNVALVFGMFLILMAIVMAVAYNWYVGRKESAGGA